MSSAFGGEIRGGFEVRYEHRVLFTDGVFELGNPALAGVLAAKDRANVIVFVDSALARRAPEIAAYLQAHARLLRPPVIVPGGEAAKRDSAAFERAVQELHDVGLDRHSYCLIVGGGAVLDAVGFAAAVVHRGVRVVRVPTTVLAQDDAGVGVKCGIDAFGKKNFLGAFAPPWAVLNDFALLRGLPAEHWRDGTIEAVKVGLIRDAGFFGWVEASVPKLRERDEDAFRYLIRRSAELHVAHIAGGGDPFERGSARPLDFGHWAAHKVEQLTRFAVSHGSAVATGIAIDTLYARRAGLTTEAVAARVFRVLRGLGFPLTADVEAADVMAGLGEFREHLGGELTITLLRDVGRAVEVHEVDAALMRQCVAEVCAGELAGSGV